MNKSKPLFATPASAYYLILGSVIALSSLGLVMVLSASSVKSFENLATLLALYFAKRFFLFWQQGLHG